MCQEMLHMCTSVLKSNGLEASMAELRGGSDYTMALQRLKARAMHGICLSEVDLLGLMPQAKNMAQGQSIACDILDFLRFSRPCTHSFRIKKKLKIG